MNEELGYMVQTPTAAGIAVPAFRPLPEPLPLVPYVVLPPLIYVSGQLPDGDGVPPVRGVVGADVDLETAKVAGRSVALNLLAALEHAAGDLRKVSRIVKLTVFVRSAAGFVDQPAVANAVSQVFVDLWGPDRGRHARSAIGVSELPLGAPVEAELIAEVHK